jgi:hypothetical protein
MPIASAVKDIKRVELAKGLPGPHQPSIASPNCGSIVRSCFSRRLRNGRRSLPTLRILRQVGRPFWYPRSARQRSKRQFDSADRRDDMKPRWQRGRPYVARRIGSGLGKPGLIFFEATRPGSVEAGLQEMLRLD